MVGHTWIVSHTYVVFGTYIYALCKVKFALDSDLHVLVSQKNSLDLLER